MAIRWTQNAWKEVSFLTVKRCFEKSGFLKNDDDVMEDEKEDTEFSVLVQELCPDLSPDEYVDFDDAVSTAELHLRLIR